MKTSQKGVAPRLVLLLLLFAFGGVAQAQHEHQHSGLSTSALPIYDNLGSHGRMITTSSTMAQSYFDQGLRLQYAFNHAEAIRSYERALEYDDSCAMCWWGIALASGPNINAGMDEAGGARAIDAVRKATELGEQATKKEKGLIKVLASRYSDDPNAERAALDRAYMNAMKRLAKEYSDDDDILTLYAASLMNLNPWNYWSGDYGNRIPNEGTEELLANLEKALEIDKNNPGACHYYIHAVEAAYPERAVECADRLASLMPGAGHIVHMPGHIYIRVGRYRDAVEANDHAVHSDESFIADQSPIGLYPSAYYPHNYHFMAFAATMAGMSAKALEAATIVAPKVPVEVASQIYWIQNVTILPQLINLNFGNWDAVLDAGLPPSELGVATVTSLYARGVAHAAKGEFGAAKQQLERIDAVAREFDPDGENQIVKIARLSLSGEIKLRSGNASAAVEEFRSAADIEDEMLYEEPPLWYYPVRHSLGRALLEAGRPAEAEAAYRQDLLRFRENGWSLFGLMKALEAQGKRTEAKAVQKRFEKAWQDADIELVQSRF